MLHDGPIGKVLPRLKGVKRCGDGSWEACCPAHDDRHPSLSVSVGDEGQVLMHCHAGCDFESILSALEFEARDLFAEKAPASSGGGRSGTWQVLKSYDYRDAAGKLLYQVCRMQPRGKEKKPFRVRRPRDGNWVWSLKAGRFKQGRSGNYFELKKGDFDSLDVVTLDAVDLVLYRLPEILKAKEDGQRIVICEGEKDADVGAAVGLAATTFQGGAGKWRSSYCDALVGARVAVVPDFDAAGKKGAERICRSLVDRDIEVRRIELGGTSPGYDLADWIQERRREGLSKAQICDRFLALIEAAEAILPSNGDGLPKIVLGLDQMKVVDQAIGVLAGRPEIYRRGGALVHVVRDEDEAGQIHRCPEAPTIQPVASARLQELLSASARWQDPETQKLIHPRRWVVEALEARASWPQIRPLASVVETPMLRPDGSVLESAGYDRDSRLLFEPNAIYPKVSEQPTRADAETAAEDLLEAVCDFPFAEPCHRAAWLASVLTGLARFAYGGPAPIFLIDANVRGAGKSMLADVIALIVTGRPMARMAPTENDAEERKRITAIALAGDPLVLIDNVAGKLGTPSLDAALTATTWSDRLLGKSLQLRLPLDVVWFATGNNLIVGGDTSRRGMHIRLDSPEEFPEQREGFKHPNLVKWVGEHRPRLVAAALTILRGFVAAGRPDMGLNPWGSFEEWSALIRGALVWAGQPDPGETRQALQRDGDPERQILERLLEGWQEAQLLLGGPLAVQQVLNHLEQHPRSLEPLRSVLVELGYAAPGQLPKVRVVANRIKKFAGRVVDGKAFVRQGKNKFGRTWIVQETGSEPFGDFR